MAEWGSDRQWIHDIDEKPEEKVEDEVETGITGGKGYYIFSANLMHVQCKEWVCV
jgi:hypothetical protein